MPARLAIGIVISLLALAPPSWAADKDKVFRAGAATSNITPRLGAAIVGGFTQPKAAHVHDELHARCLVLDDGDAKLVFVVCDSVGIGRDAFDHAKRVLTKETGIPSEHMLMSATHTHSGPSWNGQDAGGDYAVFLAARIVDGVKRAIHNLQPASIGWGSAQEPGQLFNRRWKMKPGTPLPDPFGGEDRVKMNPGALNPDLLEPAGPIDPEISFITVQSKEGRPIALLANYSLHYVGGVGAGHISADYFAVFADRIQQLLGADRLDPPFVGIMTNGTSGDVNNNNLRIKSVRLAPYVKMRQVADNVADKVFQAHQKVRFHDTVTLSARQKDLPLATRKPTPELVARAKAILEQPETAPLRHPRERNYAQRTLALADAPPRTDVILQAFRIGDLGVTAIPFEVFAETGLEIKAKSPLKPTFTISLANGSNGYLPTPPQHELGGYETWLGTNRVEKEASVKIVDTLLELLKQTQ